GFGFVFNGFDPASPTALISFLGPPQSPAFQFTFPFPAASFVPAGTQAVVADPASPAGARLSAAAALPPGGPGLASLSPATGPTGGGTVVTITGSAFHCDTPVITFGTVAATNVTVLSTSQVRCVSPSQLFTTSTSVNVTVSQLNGTAVLANAF